MACLSIEAYDSFERGHRLKSTAHMLKVLLFILLAVVVIGANAMVLLRTAKKPKIPDSVRALRDDTYSDDAW